MDGSAVCCVRQPVKVRSAARDTRLTVACAAPQWEGGFTVFRETVNYRP